LERELVERELVRFLILIHPPVYFASVNGWRTDNHSAPHESRKRTISRTGCAATRIRYEPRLRNPSGIYM
jgi:hypothetical protein